MANNFWCFFIVKAAPRATLVSMGLYPQSPFITCALGKLNTIATMKLMIPPMPLQITNRFEVKKSAIKIRKPDSKLLIKKICENPFKNPSALPNSIRGVGLGCALSRRNMSLSANASHVSKTKGRVSTGMSCFFKRADKNFVVGTLKNVRAASKIHIDAVGSKNVGMAIPIKKALYPQSPCSTECRS